MKEFFTEFMSLLANCVLVICLALVSFLLISNFYHYKEVSYSYDADLGNNANYNEYKKIMKRVDKKMKSVNYKDPKYVTTAKPIYEYYSSCTESLAKSTYLKLEGKSGVSAVDIYNANNEILKEYNNKCIFGLPYNISTINGEKSVNKSFVKTKKLIDTKSDIILDGAKNLTEAGLGNSSYGFVTDVTRGTIYNKVENELNLTIDNYKVMALLLEDVANWYVGEYGGNS